MPSFMRGSCIPYLESLLAHRPVCVLPLNHHNNISPSMQSSNSASSSQARKRGASETVLEEDLRRQERGGPWTETSAPTDSASQVSEDRSEIEPEETLAQGEEVAAAGGSQIHLDPSEAAGPEETSPHAQAVAAAGGFQTNVAPPESTETSATESTDPDVQAEMVKLRDNTMRSVEDPMWTEYIHLAQPQAPQGTKLQCEHQCGGRCQHIWFEGRSWRRHMWRVRHTGSELYHKNCDISCPMWPHLRDSSMFDLI